MPVAVLPSTRTAETSHSDLPIFLRSLVTALREASGLEKEQRYPTIGARAQSTTWVVSALAVKMPTAPSGRLAQAISTTSLPAGAGKGAYLETWQSKPAFLDRFE